MKKKKSTRKPYYLNSSVGDFTSSEIGKLIPKKLLYKYCEGLCKYKGIADKEFERCFLKSNGKRYAESGENKICKEIFNMYYDYNFLKQWIRNAFFLLYREEEMENLERGYRCMYNDYTREILRNATQISVITNSFQRDIIQWKYNYELAKAPTFKETRKTLDRQYEETSKASSLEDKYERLQKLRNDIAEYNIIKNNDNIIPTLEHHAGIDYWIDGIPVDQKTSLGFPKSYKVEEVNTNNATVAKIYKNKKKIIQKIFSLSNGRTKIKESNSFYNRLYVFGNIENKEDPFDFLEKTKNFKISSKDFINISVKNKNLSNSDIEIKASILAV